MLEIVISAEYLDGHRVRLTFSDGLVKTANLGPMLTHGVYEPLKDIEYFKTFRVDDVAGTMVWPNGADVAPDTLYLMGVDEDDAA